MYTIDVIIYSYQLTLTIIDPVERLTVEEFVHHPFLSEHAPERTLRY
jgi:hypothetical protein